MLLHTLSRQALRLQASAFSEIIFDSGVQVLGALDENNPAHYDIIDETAGREKVASIPMDEQMWELVGNRTAEMLDAAGWDVDAVGEALADLDYEQ